MLATLVQVKQASSKNFWYSNHINEQFWVTLRDVYWYQCVLQTMNCFPRQLEGKDFVILKEADIDLVQTIQTNKVFYDSKKEQDDNTQISLEEFMISLQHLFQKNGYVEDWVPTDRIVNGWSKRWVNKEAQIVQIEFDLGDPGIINWRLGEKSKRNKINIYESGNDSFIATLQTIENFTNNEICEEDDCDVNC